MLERTVMLLNFISERETQDADVQGGHGSMSLECDKVTVAEDQGIRKYETNHYNWN